MGDDKGYKDTKEFTCTGCGKTIVLTKFASQKTCKCDECKKNGVPTNPDIVAEALAKNPPKERKKSSGASTSRTKICKCIDCGVDVEVSKFMSAEKVRCDKCKGEQHSRSISMNCDEDEDEQINTGSIVRTLNKHHPNTSVIANSRLRKVKCPACGYEHMKVIRILDGSRFGLVISYQCPSCFIFATFSEQHRRMVYDYEIDGLVRFDYCGAKLESLCMKWLDSSRMANALSILIKTCRENNINIDDVVCNVEDNVPPYASENVKPVPVGFTIPPRDIWIKTIDDIINTLEAPLGATEGEYISIGVDDARLIVDKLKQLLKGDNVDV